MQKLKPNLSNRVKLFVLNWAVRDLTKVPFGRKTIEKKIGGHLRHSTGP